jgi:hypothetical protein
VQGIVNEAMDDSWAAEQEDEMQVTTVVLEGGVCAGGGSVSVIELS